MFYCYALQHRSPHGPISNLRHDAVTSLHHSPVHLRSQRIVSQIYRAERKFVIHCSNLQRFFKFIMAKFHLVARRNTRHPPHRGNG